MTGFSGKGQRSTGLSSLPQFLAHRTESASSQNRRQRRRSPGKRKSLFQILEQRAMLDAVSWVKSGSGNWDVAANWLDSTTNTHRLPGSGDNVTISTASAATITIQSGDSESVGSLTTDSNDTLSFPVDGTRAGLDYGVLDVQGTATLDGAINVTLASGYTPGSVDTYQPILYGSQSGTPTVNVPSGEAEFVTPASLYVVPAGSGSLTVTDTADSGTGSLRDAISTADASTNPVELVSFDIPTGDLGYNAASGVWTISPGSALPAVTGHAIIDATTQPSYAGKPVIQLAGESTGSKVSGLDITGGHGRVSGLAINGFNGDGIDVSGIGFDTLTGNFVGTNAAGTTAVPNSGYGVSIYGAATNDVIGGTVPAAANVISGNGFSGVWIGGTGTSGNLVEGNFIGTNAAGTNAVGNSESGVAIRGGATNNTIGGTVPGAANLISGNGGANGPSGVFIGDTGTSGNVVLGNFIGTNAAGTAGLPNSGDGVAIRGAATNNTIGGTTTAAANVISGNGYCGVYIGDTGTSGNLVEGNFIGTNAAGTNAVGNSESGVAIRGGATNNTIGGTVPGAANLISGNGGTNGPSGVFIGDTGTSGNVVLGNVIGTNAAGTAALPNSGYGVAIRGAATNNTIGGTTTGAANVISGNGYGGVYISDAGTAGNVVLGNVIGTNAAGTAALGNSGNGVLILGAATNNTIGGTAAGADNVISGNVGNGIYISGTGTSGDVVLGNFIGTNAAGAAGLPNSGFGVTIQGGATDNTIGGATTGSANVISGNSHTGVHISDTGTAGNVVLGNFIGTNAAGTAALGNGGSGVAIRGGATNNIIGGGVSGAANVISGNGGANGSSGVFIGDTGTSGNVVLGNFIGTGPGGGPSLGNNGDGVEIASAATKNTIGGSAAGAGNAIAFNTNDGVLVDTGTQNLISQNSILSNGHLGIELTDNGNNNQPAPALKSVTSGPDGTSVTGSLTSAANATFTLEFFANAVGPSSGYSEGRTFLGSHTVTTNASGVADFTVDVPVSVPTDESVVTATATDSNDNTSPFSNDVTSVTVLPASSVKALPETETAATFTVSWSGSDSGGPGIATYSVYVSDNSGPFTAFQTNTVAISAPFTGVDGHTYAFYSVATDNVGNVQSAPAAAQAITTVNAVPFSVIDHTYVIGSGTITVSAANGLLGGDTGPTQLTVTAGTVTGAQGGSFAIQSDGSFTYTPPANFPGYDSVQFAVSDASGDKATQTVNVLSQHASLVWKFYESVLNRTPDPAGLQYWTNYFDNGGSTGDMAFGFFESDELLNKVLGNYYEQYLRRPLDASGLAYWKSVWHATGGPEQIKAGFADSPEFYNSAGGTQDSWIDALYQRILNRTPDPDGKSYWLNYYQQQAAAGVDAGTVRYQIALGFFTAAEAFGEDVTGWFQEYLFRAPTDAEKAQYVSQMQGGATDRTIEQAITNLPEYANNPQAPPAGTVEPLSSYYQTTAQSQAAVTAKDAFFSDL